METCNLIDNYYPAARPGRLSFACLFRESVLLLVCESLEMQRLEEEGCYYMLTDGNQFKVNFHSNHVAIGSK